MYRHLYISQPKYFFRKVFVGKPGPFRAIVLAQGLRATISGFSSSPTYEGHHGLPRPPILLNFGYEVAMTFPCDLSKDDLAVTSTLTSRDVLLNVPIARNECVVERPL